MWTENRVCAGWGCLRRTQNTPVSPLDKEWTLFRDTVRSRTRWTPPSEPQCHWTPHKQNTSQLSTTILLRLMQTPPLELEIEIRFDFFTRRILFHCLQLKVWTVVQQIRCSPVVSPSHALTLTLVDPVGDTIKDLVPFTVGGHLHCFRSYAWFEKNVVLRNISLRNTAESWLGHIQALTD